VLPPTELSVTMAPSYYPITVGEPAHEKKLGYFIMLKNSFLSLNFRNKYDSIVYFYFISHITCAPVTNRKQ
jgi:hypothetical protein